MRVLAWPRSPRKITSWPASSAFSSCGQHRVLVAEHAVEQRLAGPDLGDGVAPDLLLDRAMDSQPDSRRAAEGGGSETWVQPIRSPVGANGATVRQTPPRMTRSRRLVARRVPSWPCWPGASGPLDRRRGRAGAGHDAPPHRREPDSPPAVQPGVGHRHGGGIAGIARRRRSPRRSPSPWRRPAGATAPRSPASRSTARRRRSRGTAAGRSSSTATATLDAS